jgi:predicted esterase
MNMLLNDPHKDQEIIYRGKTKDAESAMILIHGRGADAESILSITGDLGLKDYLYAAPQAYRNRWYPHSFLSLVGSNEPDLTSGLNVIDSIIKNLNESGISYSEIILLGFSQGACLVLEYAARNAKKFKGVIGLSGGLIGKNIEQSRYSGSFDGGIVFLGCGSIDTHIPEERVHQTADVMFDLKASVTKRIYHGMGHTVNEDEINFIKSIM